MSKTQAMTDIQSVIATAQRIANTSNYNRTAPVHLLGGLALHYKNVFAGSGVDLDTLYDRIAQPSVQVHPQTSSDQLPEMSITARSVLNQAVSRGWHQGRDYYTPEDLFLTLLHLDDGTIATCLRFAGCPDVRAYYQALKGEMQAAA